MSGWSTIPPRARRWRSIPSVADPVLDAAAARGWRITPVWNTHWHPDHTGGNDAIRAATGCTITGPAEAEQVSKLDRIVAGGDRARIGEIEAELIDIPAHTAGHVAFHLPAEQVAFVGDTLFAMGCGRLFEGDARRRCTTALQRLAALPPETRVYCGHEYTLANGRFALTVEPDNQALVERMAEVEALRARGEVDPADDDRAGARDQPLHARRLGRGAGGAAGGEGRLLATRPSFRAKAGIALVFKPRLQRQ